MVDVESGEALCPPRICPGARTRRPGVLARLAGGGRPARLHRWIGAIRRRDRPTLYFQHALLPHEPWLYLPSGHAARPKGNDPIPGINRPIGFHDPDLTRHNEARHLLQVGFVDRQIGLLLDRLRAHRAAARTRCVVVTADHGYAFEVGVKDRRLVTESNVDEIAPVAALREDAGPDRGRGEPQRGAQLRPGAHRGRLARTPASGGSTTAAPRSRRRPAARRTISIVTRDFKHTIRIGLAEMQRRRAANRARRARTVPHRSAERPIVRLALGVALPRGLPPGADRAPGRRHAAIAARGRCEPCWRTPGCRERWIRPEEILPDAGDRHAWRGPAAGSRATWPWP